MSCLWSKMFFTNTLLKISLQLLIIHEVAHGSALGSLTHFILKCRYVHLIWSLLGEKWTIKFQSGYDEHFSSVNFWLNLQKHNEHVPCRGQRIHYVQPWTSTYTLQLGWWSAPVGGLCLKERSPGWVVAEWSEASTAHQLRWFKHLIIDPGTDPGFSLVWDPPGGAGGCQRKGMSGFLSWICCLFHPTTDTFDSFLMCCLRWCDSEHNSFSRSKSQ